MRTSILKLTVSGLLICCALVILVSLGIWQLQRKEWKETLILDLDRRANIPATPVPDRLVWGSWNPVNDEFRHVAADGVYLNDKEIQVYGLMPAKQAGVRSSVELLQGYYLFTPLQRSDGSIIFINRGFVPNESGIEVKRDFGLVRIEGISRAPEQRGWFVPENEPAKGQWYTRDSDAMAQALGFTVYAPFYIEENASLAPSWPRGSVTRNITLKNNHLQYALTWFGLAFALVGVTGYALFRR